MRRRNLTCGSEGRGWHKDVANSGRYVFHRHAAEIRIAEAALSHGCNKFGRGAEDRPVGNTCHRGSGTHEEDGAGQLLMMH